MYVGAGVDPTVYSTYYTSGLVPTIKVAGSYAPNTITYQSTGYRYFTAAIRTVGLYSFSVTQGAGDPISAIYAKANSDLAYDPSSPLANLYVFNDDSQGAPRTGPWTVYYNNTAAGCTVIQFLIYEFNGEGASMTGSYNISGPGSVSATCSGPSTPSPPAPPSGPSAGDTLVSLTRSVAAIKSAVSFRHGIMSSLLDYDSNQFGERNISLSFIGRYSALGDQFGEGAGAVTAAYRVNPNFRVGLFVDYAPLNYDWGGVRFDTVTPSVGGFAVYETNRDLTRWNARIASAYNSGDVMISRSAYASAEAGSGISSIAAVGMSGEIGYGRRLNETLVAVPYFGLRFTDVTRKAYSENATASVTKPINYLDYSQKLLTGLSGFRLYSQLTKEVSAFLAIGAEFDLLRKMDHYQGTSDISGVETFKINTSSPAQRVRGAIGAGFSHQLTERQRLAAQVSVRHQPDSSRAGVTSMVSYSVGF